MLAVHYTAAVGFPFPSLSRSTVAVKPKQPDFIAKSGCLNFILSAPQVVVVCPELKTSGQQRVLWNTTKNCAEAERDRLMLKNKKVQVRSRTKARHT
jgi:hypothetical protein